MAVSRDREISDVRPAMDVSAPWSATGRRYRPKDTADRAVVYVVGPEDGEWVKVGFTGSIKDRLSELQRDHRTRLHIIFWMELPASCAFSLEQATLRTLRRLSPPMNGREQFSISGEVAATAVVLSARRLGYAQAKMAGFPGAFDVYAGEIEELLGEPHYMQDGVKKGRMDREFWSPQNRAVGG